MSNAARIAQKLKIDSWQVVAVIELLDAGNTIPFIARYRKEATNGLDEEQLRQIQTLLERLRSLEKRRETILRAISEQGALTDELKARILGAESRTELEDLYQPYKPKRKTRASIARQRGLAPLAQLILEQPETTQPLETLAQPYLCEEVPSCEEAWSGARDIVAETISDHSDIRHMVRLRCAQSGVLVAEKVEKTNDPRGVYQHYYEFEYRVDRLRPHQILAIYRGCKEKVLRVKIKFHERDWRPVVEDFFPRNPRSPLAGQLEQAVEEAAKRLLLPSIERHIHRALAEKAESHAIQVFATNLRNLLSQPPLPNHRVLGIDPGYRTGCKIAVVDRTGKVLETATIYPHPPQRQVAQAIRTLATLVNRHSVTLVAIGNGTACRETEALVADLIAHLEQNLHYLIVSEAGASVYSASKLARQELPGMDVALRGAVSIARRVQDPLAELVKIDPKSLGVGMYQHDVNQKELGRALDAVVESVVNQVGVDVNTASPSLLTHVAGIGPTLATRIVDYRDQHGPFRNRSQLLSVPGLGSKAYQQAAGFLRIRDGDNPLEASAIHPESYAIAEQVLSRAGLQLDTPPQDRVSALEDLRSRVPLPTLAEELGTGVLTLVDIFEQLARPGLDPREDLPPPILRSDVLRMEDLKPGMVLKGTVRNVVDFGSFIDIGVKQDGLLHRSQIPKRVHLAIGDIIEVKILKIEIERGRISLGWGKALSGNS